ncbi:hypothetical protein VW23_001150 [Devosia insulae DS-56]|uniref:Uncharacterized protein n=1 Tax=Devosia insulae DS-56 TaxID=1116389 RepID=A0A1E5XSC0_9HYPH|nr:hypothetical protein VW23_001150 [Devosia insulae DS-56]
MLGEGVADTGAYPIAHRRSMGMSLVPLRVDARLLAPVWMLRSLPEIQLITISQQTFAPAMESTAARFALDSKA